MVELTGVKVDEVAVEAERFAIRGYTNICNLTAGK